MTTSAPNLADYGSDLYGIDDLDELARVVTGVEVLRQALARRLMTPRGWLIDDPNYGLDVRRYLSDSIDAAKLMQIQGAVRSEVLKDPRVLTCSVVATMSGSFSARAVTLRIDGESRQGPYDLVVDVSKVSATLLQTGAQ